MPEICTGDSTSNLTGMLNQIVRASYLSLVQADDSVLYCSLRIRMNLRSNWTISPVETGVSVEANVLNADLEMKKEAEVIFDQSKWSGGV